MRLGPFAIVSALLVLAGAASAALAGPEAGTGDPFLWLEQVDGARAMAWVQAENRRTLGILTADPHYRRFYDEALAIAEAPDRIPTPDFLAGQVYNFWQDGAHVQGLWRRTTLDSYRGAQPDWTVVLDLDALSRQQGRHFVWKGAACLQPEDRRCIVQLSDGGEDATVAREVDAASGAFVLGGFDLPRAKQSLDWEDADTLLVATDWGPGSMTGSGYPFVVKRLRRGRPLAAAEEVFRGTPQDVTVEVAAYVDGQHHRALVLKRGLDFFRSAFLLVGRSGVRRLNLPEKADLHGLVRNRLIATLNEPYRGLAAGSLVALDLGRADASPEPVFVPGPAQALDDAMVSRDRVFASILDHVRGQALVFTPSGAGVGAGAGGGWSARRLDLPQDASITLVSANDRDDRAFIEAAGFLQPTTLYLADGAAAGPPLRLRALPPRFDASRDTVDQYEAVSKDGTRIPYFVVHPRGMKADGSNPTLLYAYGGFQVSMTPSYNGVLGKLWLERGGVYVLANIRGGGEFGPAWHEAGLKTHRQRVYDDFAAVAQDLIARRITSPARLGIRGGSNGGLLMGVEFEQHPELWRAVIIDVPLLDMLRFERIAAGASWVGEYGSVADRAERAFLAGISPYANLRPGVRYPEPFIFTTTKDDRVGPVHARKFAARMAAMGLPYLYYEATEGGHAAGANLREMAQEQALEMTYLTRKLMPEEQTR